MTSVRALFVSVSVLVVAAGTLLAGLVTANAVALPGAAPTNATLAAPDPDAPHSGASIPAVTGAAAQQLNFPESPAQRRAELTAAAQRPASTTAPSAVTPNLPVWSGAFHGYWGAFPRQPSTGAQATQSVNPNVKLSSSDTDTVYMPTLYPTGASCIEVTTIHFRGENGVGAWDWCGPHGFHVVKLFDTTFLATYTVSISGQKFYTVQDVRTRTTPNTWTAYLYNYKTKRWDSLFTSSGSTGGTGFGWAMHEVYTNYNSSTHEGRYCTDSSGASWETTSLKYQIGGAWVAASTSNTFMNLSYPRGSDLGCSDESFWLPNANSDFKVTNSTHGPGELIGAGAGRCVDTSAGVFANGTREQIWDCNHSPGQTWSYNALGELTVDGGRFCLDAAGHGTADGTKIQLWTCLNGPNQEWSFSVTHTIVGIQSGKCLDVANHGTTNGSQLQLSTCSGAPSQQWSW